MDQKIALNTIKRDVSQKQENNLVRNLGDDGAALTTRVLSGTSSNPHSVNFLCLLSDDGKKKNHKQAMPVKQVSLQMSLQFLPEFFFFSITLRGMVLTDLTASTFCLSFMEEAFPTGINS